MNLRILGATAVAGTLAACSPKVITKTEIKTVQVAVRAPCPDRPTYDDLKAGRPVPLRTQPMPPSPEQRVAQSQAQLGRYEAEGAWADRVSAALDRCQAEGVAAPGDIE